MKYENIQEGIFIDRPNRFLANIIINGQTETVHVKNTGRCRELLKPGATVYVQDSCNPQRKTRWDLIGVRKGNRMVNMDSQAPNKAVKEWVEKGNLIRDAVSVRAEYSYGNSRVDLYVEAAERKVLIEVKGVTLEEDGVVRFPDAPSERAVKHVKELKNAVREGYEAYVFFVVQMEGVRYFTPNRETHPEFADALADAAREGVKVVAYDCRTDETSMEISRPVPVVLEEPVLYEIRNPLLKWYQSHKRNLPWRNNPEPYRVWVSEIMLQQTRVEAVKAYYDRFLKALPEVQDLAGAKEEQLLKLWEGLGYYNRVRNMQKAAQQIVDQYGGQFPKSYEEIRRLKGIGSYTAGAICSFAYGQPVPAVDGNVLRVVTRLLEDPSDIMKQSTKAKIERQLADVIPEDAAGDFNQGLIELGAIVCVPNGQPKCQECPVSHFCSAQKNGTIDQFPVKTKAKDRKIEKKTILVFRDGEKTAIKKRADRGLLAGLYELPNVEGTLNMEEVIRYSKNIGLMPMRIRELGEEKHIFSHIEWHMLGYEIKVDELEKTNKKDFLFIHPEEIQKKYPIPTAFEKYMPVWEEK